MTQRTSVLRVALSVSALAIVCAPAEAARIKIPKEIVLETYQQPAGLLNEPVEGAAATAASGPARAFTRADFARLGVVSRSYPETIAKMRNVLDYIRQRSPVPGLNPEIQLFNSELPEARAVNKDLIVVSTGLLKALEEESDQTRADALAFILAHEYAHLLFDHPQAYQTQLEKTNVSKQIGEGYAALKKVQLTHYQLSGESNKAFYDAEKAFMGAAAASPWVEAELYRAVYAPYVKEQEQLADYLAADLLSDKETPETPFDAKNGAEPIRSLYKVYHSQARDDARALAEDLNETSLTAGRDIAAAAPATLASGNADQLETIAVTRVKLGLAHFGLKTIGKRLDRSRVHIYYSADRRVDAIGTYAAQFYPPRPVDVSNATLSRFAAARAARGVGASFKNEHTASAAARQAMTFLARGDVAGAEKALKDVSNENAALGNIAYLVASADVAFAKGDLARAIELYRKAIRRDDAPVRAYINLSKSHLRNGNEEKTLEALALGEKRFSKREFIVARIDAYVVMGREEDALAAYGECQSLGDDALAKRCARAADAYLKPDKENGGNRFKGILDRATKSVEDIVN